jgi:hypothetical protein
MMFVLQQLLLVKLDLLLFEFQHAYQIDLIIVVVIHLLLGFLIQLKQNELDGELKFLLVQLYSNLKLLNLIKYQQDDHLINLLHQHKEVHDLLLLINQVQMLLHLLLKLFQYQLFHILDLLLHQW